MILTRLASYISRVTKSMPIFANFSRAINSRKYWTWPRSRPRETLAAIAMRRSTWRESAAAPRSLLYPAAYIALTHMYAGTAGRTVNNGRAHFLPFVEYFFRSLVTRAGQIGGTAERPDRRHKFREVPRLFSPRVRPESLSLSLAEIAGMNHPAIYADYSAAYGAIRKTLAVCLFFSILFFAAAALPASEWKRDTEREREREREKETLARRASSDKR